MHAKFVNKNLNFLNYSLRASLVALARGSKSVEAADINAAAPDVLKQFRI